MKGKMCDGNMNMAICILMGVLLLIIIWYVFMGPRKESFATITASNGETTVTTTGYRDIDAVGVLADTLNGVDIIPNAIARTAVRADLLT